MNDLFILNHITLRLNIP